MTLFWCQRNRSLRTCPAISVLVIDDRHQDYMNCIPLATGESAFPCRFSTVGPFSLESEGAPPRRVHLLPFHRSLRLFSFCCASPDALQRALSPADLDPATAALGLRTRGLSAGVCRRASKCSEQPQNTAGQKRRTPAPSGVPRPNK